jgi:hypothetical protein
MSLERRTTYEWGASADAPKNSRRGRDVEVVLEDVRVVWRVHDVEEEVEVVAPVHVDRDAGLELEVLPPARGARRADVERVRAVLQQPRLELRALALGVITCARAPQGLGSRRVARPTPREAALVELLVHRADELHDVGRHTLVRREVGQVVGEALLGQGRDRLRAPAEPDAAEMVPAVALVRPHLRVLGRVLRRKTQSYGPGRYLPSPISR